MLFVQVQIVPQSFKSTLGSYACVLDYIRLFLLMLTVNEVGDVSTDVGTGRRTVLPNLFW